MHPTPIGPGHLHPMLLIHCAQRMAAICNDARVHPFVKEVAARHASLFLAFQEKEWGKR